MNGLETRKILIGKRGYRSYCGTCKYNVKAEVEMRHFGKEQYKTGWIGVHCCIYPCPYYIAPETLLGKKQELDFNKQWTPWKRWIPEPEQVEFKKPTDSEKQRSLNNHE